MRRPTVRFAALSLAFLVVACLAAPKTPLFGIGRVELVIILGMFAAMLGGAIAIAVVLTKRKQDE